MRILGAVIITLFFGSFLPAAYADTCGCQDLGFDYQLNEVGKTGQQIQNEELMMEELPWRVIAIEPVYDMTKPEEPIISCHVTIELVGDGDPEQESYQQNPDGNDSIFFAGHWVPYEKFEPGVIKAGCQIGTGV